MSQRYLVLDSDPRDDALRWTFDRALPTCLPDVAFTYAFRDRGGPDLLRDRWEATGAVAILSLVSDRRTPAHYLMIEAGSPELVERIAAAVSSVLPVIPLATLQVRAETSDDPSALVRLALGSDARGPDDRSAEIIAKGFDHPDALVRYRAAEAAGLAPRRDFGPRLAAMAGDDPDPAVRGMAVIAARTCGSVATPVK